MIIELSIIAVCTIILLTILLILLHLGYFKHVDVKSGRSPVLFANKVFAFKSFKDNYSGIGYQFTVLHNLTAVQPTEIRNKLSEAIAIGIYYDSPDKVKDECKFTIGLLLDGESDCEEVKELLSKENYELTVFPDVDNVVHATFPFKGSVSIPIAIRSVYPKLNDFIKTNKIFAYPSMEFYTKDEIHFILPLEKQQDFVFFTHQEESSDDEEIDENSEMKILPDDDKSSNNELRKRSKGLKSNSNDKSVDNELRKLPKEFNSNDKSPDNELRKRAKELRRSSSGSSFDELYLDEDNDKNV